MSRCCRNGLVGLFLFVLVGLLASCQGCGRSEVKLSDGDTIRMEYAKLLQMVDHGSYVEVILQNPWQKGKEMHRYLLVPKGEKGDATVQSLSAMRGRGRRVDIVRTPIERSVVFTSPHCQLMYELGCADCIAGVCDLDYINIPDLNKRALSSAVDDKEGEGRVVDCGSSFQPMIEKIIDLKPEVLLISPFENSGGYGKLDKLNVPIIETADYMEVSPLARAEWIKFYGALFGGEHSDGSYYTCKEKADSLFQSISDKYLNLKVMASRLPKGRSILTERKTNGVWYVPGGKSTMGVLLADANAKYIYASDGHSGSLALSPEEVLDKAKDIDVWAFKYIASKPLTRADLLQEYKGYRMLKPFETGDIYECNTGVIPYFEQTTFHPELLLREFIQLAHPRVKLGGLKYYTRMTAAEYGQGSRL